MLNVRVYQPGDEHQILHLFNQVFQQDISLDFWKWRFKDNPSGKAIIKLVFDEEKLVGHYAVIPMSLQISGNLLKAQFSMTTMTHPEYTGRGIFTNLANEVYKSCGDQGVSLVYGFPNDNSYPGFTRKLGWQGLGKTIVFEKMLETKSRSHQEKPGIQAASLFDSRIDELWKKTKNQFEVIVPRKKDYLNWRFIYNPEVQYKVFVHTGQGDEITGYVVLKSYLRKEEKIGHIVDLLAIDEKKTISDLLKASFEHFLSQNIIKVTGWFHPESLYSRCLVEEGFRESGTGQNFGVRKFNALTETMAEKAGSFQNWYLTMSDSDVF